MSSCRCRLGALALHGVVRLRREFQHPLLDCALTLTALCLGAALSSGCTSHGLLQTAHTVAPSRLVLQAGAARVYNRIDEQGGRGAVSNTSGEPALRLGLSDSIDFGVGPFLSRGGKMDAKLNLFDNSRRAALAPRVSLGGALPDGRQMLAAEVGLIASYRALTWLEPYAGSSFANHWMFGAPEVSELNLAPDQSLAEPSGYGDGLVKITLGVDVRPHPSLGLLAEYSHWFVAQNDSGNGFVFIPNDVVAVALRYDIVD